MRSLILIAVIASSSVLRAQTPPEFDVASVKPVDPGNGTASYSSSNEYMGSLQSLIKSAYGVEDYRIAGGPKWLDGDKFRIVFKPANAPQRNLMLRTLLADRFKLVLHPETKELPIYALVIGKGGPKMEKAEGPGGTANGPAMIRGTMDMAFLASTLSSTLGRRVIDRTSLTGPYKFSLKWTPDDRPASADNSGPSLFTAIQEQLGLKLESTKGPVEILVIDHAEKPSEN
jgi:uncharacterized protein (TIGR03435 family)